MQIIQKLLEGVQNVSFVQRTRHLFRKVIPKHSINGPWFLLFKRRVLSALPYLASSVWASEEKTKSPTSGIKVNM